MAGTITRGRVIRADLALWDGKTATYTRADASGGTVTGLAVGNEVDVLQTYGSGTARTRTSIKAAIDVIGTTAVALSFAPGTWTIDDDLTIGSNFACRIPAGAVFNVSSGKTLTFSGPVYAESSTFYSGSGTTTLSVDSIVGGKEWIARTAAEIAISVTPVNYAYEPGELLRQATNTTPGTTDMATGFQAAIDAASDIYAEIYARDEIGLSKPLLIRTTTQQSLGIIGNGRVSTILAPLAADIKVAAQNINCLFFNQNNNGHLRLEKIRCLDAAAFTGKFLYSLEGGGADASGQAAFSMVVSDCWFSFSSNNTGYFHGGFSNLLVISTVFEGTKAGCWILEGAGNADQQHIGVTMNSCYDSYILATADTLIKAVISISGLHAYQHLRGRLVEGKTFTECVFQDIIFEPDAANVGDTGVLKLTDSSNIIASNILMMSRSGVPRGAVCLEFINGATGSYSHIRSDAVTGVAFSGTGALDLSFSDCDFIGCDNAITFAGTLSGKIVLNRCRLNDMQAFGLIVLSGTHSWDLTMIDCEIMNAGLRATATDRNFDLNTSGKVRLIRCKIGQDNASAAADYYVRAVGSGILEIIDPIIVGTPPSAALFYTGSQVPTLDGVDSSMPGVPQFVPAVGGTATYTVQQGQWSLKGKTLTFNGRLTINAIGTGSATVVSGLPFTSHATIYGFGYASFFASIASTVTSLGLTVAPGGTSFTMRTLVAAATGTGTSSVFQNSADVMFGGSYPVP